MGVDYRGAGIDLDGNPDNGSEGDIYTQLQVMKFAPCIAATIAPGVSVGAALHLVYGALDMGYGNSENYTVGGQVGVIAHHGPFTAGINYTLPEKIDHERVAYLDNDNRLDSLTLESPQTLSAGLAFNRGKFLIEADVKWYDWSNADGYGDFGWHDQTVYAVGAEYRDWHGFTFRLGYNYGKSPVRERDGFSANGSTVIQGKVVNNARLEYLRIVGFPAIAEEHFTGGISWQINERFQAHAGFTYSPSRTIKERDETGSMQLSSEMIQRSYEIGLSWNFF
jgi:long-chain fatty acid transport protein